MSFRRGNMNADFVPDWPNLDLGVEFRHGERETYNGLDGSLDRVHLVAKQSF